MDEADIASAAARLRRQVEERLGAPLDPATLCDRAERQLLFWLTQHDAPADLMMHFDLPPRDEGLSFVDVARIIGGFAYAERPRFLRATYLAAVLMRQPAAADDAATALGLPESWRDGSFYDGPTFPVEPD